MIVLLDGDLVQAPEHLGVAYVLAALREGGLQGFIAEVSAGQEEPVLEALASKRLLYVGLTLTTVSVPRATRFGNRLRELTGPGLHITAGGPLATFLGAKLLSNTAWRFLDSLVRGEGEVAAVALGRALSSGADLAAVPSLVYRDGDRLVTNPMAVPAPDLDQLPWPARDQIIAAKTPPPYLRISTSRGCTSQCTFCNAPHAGNNISGSRVWRGRSPESIVSELEHLATVHHVRTFDFVDSTFEDPGGSEAAKARVRRIADLILERQLDVFFNCCMQAQNWSECDDDLIGALARAGLEKVLVGIESGSDAGLRRWRKRAAVSDNHRVITVLRRHGIYVAFGYIMFHPNSTPEEIEQNAIFIRQRLGHNLRRFGTRLELYPGALEVEKLRGEGLLGTDYDTTLSPYAYSFRDPEIAKLAKCMAMLAGDEYAEQGTVLEEPPHFAFETYDVTLHTFTSRLLRRYRHHPAAEGLLSQFVADLDRARAEIADYNFGLFHSMWDSVRADRADRDTITELRRDVADRFVRWMDRLRAMQLRLGMSLRRQGIAVTPDALGGRLPA